MDNQVLIILSSLILVSILYLYYIFVLFTCIIKGPTLNDITPDSGSDEGGYFIVYEGSSFGSSESEVDPSFGSSCMLVVPHERVMCMVPSQSQNGGSTLVMTSVKVGSRTSNTKYECFVVPSFKKLILFIIGGLPMKMMTTMMVIILLYIPQIMHF